MAASDDPQWLTELEALAERITRETERLVPAPRPILRLVDALDEPRSAFRLVTDDDAGAA